MVGGIVFLAYFILRLLYMGLVTRNLKDNRDELYMGAAFIIIWAVIYFFAIFK
jgi:hypothetical protein